MVARISPGCQNQSRNWAITEGAGDSGMAPKQGLGMVPNPVHAYICSCHLSLDGVNSQPFNLCNQPGYILGLPEIGVEPTPGASRPALLSISCEYRRM